MAVLMVHLFLEVHSKHAHGHQPANSRRLPRPMAAVRERSAPGGATRPAVTGEPLFCFASPRRGLWVFF